MDPDRGGTAVMAAKKREEKKTFEFQLVLYLLGAFILFTFMILVIPLVYLALPGAAETGSIEYQKTLMDYQKEIFTVTVAAFSAWIGAGAAYFFGRENLRVATDKILEMRGLPPMEKLKRTPILDMRPPSVDWTVLRNTPLKEVFERLKDDPMRWFIIVVMEDGRLEYVIDEEGLYRFITDNPEMTPESILAEKTVNDLITHYEQRPPTDQLYRKVLKMSVRVEDTANVGYVEERMTNGNVHLAIVIDQDKKPLYYITAGDIKRCLLSLEQEPQ